MIFINNCHRKQCQQPDRLHFRQSTCSTKPSALHRVLVKPAVPQQAAVIMLSSAARLARQYGATIRGLASMAQVFVRARLMIQAVLPDAVIYTVEKMERWRCRRGSAFETQYNPS